MKLSLGDLTPQQFLDQYWQKKPLLIRNAFADFQLPISADELAGLACEEEVESRIVLHQPDSQCEADNWQLRHGPFDEDSFAELPKTNWSLLVQAVDHWVPEAADLLEQFDFIPRWRIDDLMVSYSVAGGGVGPHYDNYDVFLIQGSGSRRWEFGGKFGEDSPRKPNMPVMILPQWQAEQSFVLYPGDMLYLPPGIGHSGVSLEDGSTTWSVGFRAPSESEILQGFTDFIGEKLKSDQRYSDHDLLLQDNQGKITDAALDRLQSILKRHLEDRQALLEWFGSHMTEPKYPDLQQEPALADFDVDGYYRRSEHTRVACAEKDGLVYLFFNGEVITVEQKTPEALFIQNISANNEFKLPRERSDQLNQLIEKLVGNGVIYPV